MEWVWRDWRDCGIALTFDFERRPLEPSIQTYSAMTLLPWGRSRNFLSCRGAVSGGAHASKLGRREHHLRSRSWRQLLIQTAHGVSGAFLPVVMPRNWQGTYHGCGMCVWRVEGGGEVVTEVTEVRSRRVSWVEATAVEVGCEVRRRAEGQGDKRA